MRFVNKDELLKADLPMIPEEFEALVKKQCADAREVLTKWYVLSFLCHVPMKVSLFFYLAPNIQKCHC